MVETDTAFLVLRAPALLAEHQTEREDLLTGIADQLGVAGEVDLTTITNVAAEGTDTAARFPVSQSALSAAANSPDWSSRVSALFVVPDPA
jgi:hypothetical protein